MMDVPVERHRRYTGRDVEPRVSFDRKRLQRDGIMEPSKQRVRPDANAYGRTRRRTCIVTRKSATSQVLLRRKHSPQHHR